MYKLVTARIFIQVEPTADQEGPTDGSMAGPTFWGAFQKLKAWLQKKFWPWL